MKTFAEISGSGCSRQLPLQAGPAFLTLIMAFLQERCVSGKRVYTSHEMAEDALVEAWTRYDYHAGNGPVAVYRCEDCGYYHLTSAGPMSENLSKALRDGTIEKQREALKWERRLRKR